IALPQLVGKQAVPAFRAEERDSIQICDAEITGLRGGCAGENVLDHHGAAGGSIAHPQLAAVRTVVGAEEQLSIDVRAVTDNGAASIASRATVVHQRGAASRAVGLPQFLAMHAVVSAEE